MILDEKTLGAPPPPYQASVMRPSTGHCSISSLPSHLLLHIVYDLFPQEAGNHEGEGMLVRQRQTLHWLHTQLRLVNRHFYLTCMHILRSSYLASYDSLVRAPYTSDPFPTSTSGPSSLPGISHRELQILDLFIAVCCHEDILKDSTELHLPREEAYQDLFTLLQPRARLEDLICEQGRQQGLVYIQDWELSLRTAPVSVAVEDDDDDVTVVDSPASPSIPVKSELYSMSAPASSATLHRSPTTSILSYHAIFPPNTSSSSPAPRTSIFSFSNLPNLPNLRLKRNKGSPQPTPFPPPPSLPVKRKSIRPIPFSSLSVSFSPRKVALLFTPIKPKSRSRASTTTGNGGLLKYESVRKRVIVEVPRLKEDTLETSVKYLMKGLKSWLEHS